MPLAGEPAEHKADEQEPHGEGDEGKPTAVQEHLYRREAIAPLKSEQLARPPYQVVHVAPDAVGRTLPASCVRT